MSKCSPAHFECANDGSNTSPASNSHDALQSENARLREQVKEQQANCDRMREALEKIKLLRGGAFALEQAKEIARAALSTPTGDAKP